MADASASPPESPARTGRVGTRRERLPPRRVATVLLVIEQEILCEGLRKLVQEALGAAAERVDIVPAASLADAVRLAQAARQVELIVVDLDLPEIGPEACIACIQRDWSGLPVAVVSAGADGALGVRLMELGVRGYLQKRSSLSIMLNALRLMLAGGRYFSEEILMAVGAYARGCSDDRRVGAGGDSGHNWKALSRLSTRQREVLSLMVEGRTNRQIASDLGLSVGTAKNHVAVIMRILGVSRRVNVIRAVMSGELDLRVLHSGAR